MTERDFWSSSYLKIDYILTRYVEELEAKNGKAKEVETITDMNQIPGW